MDRPEQKRTANLFYIFCYHSLLESGLNQVDKEEFL